MPMPCDKLASLNRKDRVWVMRETETSASDNAPVFVWAPIQELWAFIRGLTGRELEVAASMQSESSHIIVVPYYPGLLCTDRFQDESTGFTYEIESVLDVDNQRRFHWCECKLSTGYGVQQPTIGPQGTVVNVPVYGDAVPGQLAQWISTTGIQGIDQADVRTLLGITGGGGSGVQGPQGVAGVQGVAGANGNNGTNGVQGSTGANGSTGTQGNSGVQGATGSNGSGGVQGQAGSNGVQGVAGSNGSAGVQGVAGTSGTQGVAGSNGASGVQGASGANGANGVQGNAGSAGSTGVQGSTGANGAAGPQGVSGSSGVQGVAGSNGAAGTQGATGSTGSSGVQGVAGSTGSSGVQGTTGSTGSSGVQGLTGSNGSAGVQGVSGSTGSAGVQGLTGSSGVQGVAGTNGNVGVQGSTGATGSGVQGVSGSNGATGVQGLTGSSGVQGVQGIQGVQGSFSPPNKGLFYLDTFMQIGTTSATLTAGPAYLAPIFQGSGSGVSLAATDSTSTHIGVMKLIATTATGNCSYCSGTPTTGSIIFGNGLHVYEAEILTDSVLSTSSQAYAIFAGFGNQYGTAANMHTQGAFFFYSNNNAGNNSNNGNGNWQCWTVGSGSNTTTDSGITVAISTWYKLRVEVQDTSSAKFYINGSLVSTINTNIPTTGFMSYHVRIAKNGVGTTANQMWADYISWQWTLTTPL